MDTDTELPLDILESQSRQDPAYQRAERRLAAVYFIAHRLHEAIADGVTAQEFAEQAGVNVEAVEQFAADEASVTVDELLHIAWALGVQLCVMPVPRPAELVPPPVSEWDEIQDYWPND